MDLNIPETPTWLDRTMRVVQVIRTESRHDNIALVAAGIAFYAVLAIFPAIFIGVSLYGLFTDLAEAERQITSMLGVFPGSAAQIVADQMRAVARASEATLSLGFLISVAAFLWTVSNATRAIVLGVKIAYDQEDGRSVLERRVVAIGITIAVIVLTMAAIAIIAAIPVWLGHIEPEGVVVTLGDLRWLVVGGGFALITGLLYRYAPPRRADRLRSVLPGTVFATAMWVVTSFGFSIYVSSFGRYNETYGTLGAAIVLLLWFWFSSLAIMIGAELNEAIALEFHGSEAHPSASVVPLEPA